MFQTLNHIMLSIRLTNAKNLDSIKGNRQKDGTFTGQYQYFLTFSKDNTICKVDFSNTIRMRNYYYDIKITKNFIDYTKMTSSGATHSSKSGFEAKKQISISKKRKKLHFQERE